MRWAGYLNGNYYTTDLTPNVLRGTANVFANPVYQGYMLREWAPILLPSTPGGGDAAVHVSDADLTARLSGNAGDTTAVVQMHYGVNDITYQVSLAEPRTLVENEMFFPGWQARLTSASADSITAVAANGVFRAWHLPAGNYAMTARFEFPYLLAMWLISGASLVAWLGLWIITWRVNRATPSR